MEEVLPPQTADGTGFELTRISQFTIFLENRVGRLHGLVRSFEDASEHIVAISIEESADTALVRIICSNPEAGRRLLEVHNYSFSESELLAVELPRESRHPLISICTAMLAAEINIHYCYPLLTHPHGPALALYVDDPTLAAQILIRKGFTLLSQNDLRL